MISYISEKGSKSMISYQPLFKTMREKNITSYALFKKGFSKATYYSIQKGNSISTNTVNQLCSLLNCSVSDVIEYIEESGFSYIFNFRVYPYNQNMRYEYD